MITFSVKVCSLYMCNNNYCRSQQISFILPSMQQLHTLQAFYGHQIFGGLLVFCIVMFLADIIVYLHVITYFDYNNPCRQVPAFQRLFCPQKANKIQPPTHSVGQVRPNLGIQLRMYIRSHYLTINLKRPVMVLLGNIFRLGSGLLCFRAVLKIAKYVQFRNVLVLTCTKCVTWHPRKRAYYAQKFTYYSFPNFSNFSPIILILISLCSIQECPSINLHKMCYMAEKFLFKEFWKVCAYIIAYLIIVISQTDLRLERQKFYICTWDHSNVPK